MNPNSGNLDFRQPADPAASGLPHCGAALPPAPPSYDFLRGEALEGLGTFAPHARRRSGLAGCIMLLAFAALTGAALAAAPDTIRIGTTASALRPLGVALLGLLGGFGLCLYGWEQFARRHRLLGAALVLGGCLIGSGGLCWLRLAESHLSWGGWL